MGAPGELTAGAPRDWLVMNLMSLRNTNTKISPADGVEHSSQGTESVGASGALRGRPTLEPYSGLNVQPRLFSFSTSSDATLERLDALNLSSSPNLDPSGHNSASGSSTNGSGVVPWGAGPPLCQVGCELNHDASAGTPCPSLVTSTPNSARACPDMVLIRGQCEVDNVVEYVEVRCKRRDCETCGPEGRRLIAERIAFGVRKVSGSRGACAWMVLTFGSDVTKTEATRRLQGLVRWLRGRMPGLEYVATYELTKRGRLHINLIAGPWGYVRQSELQRQWGGRVWVQMVRDEDAMGREAAASYSPESLGGYLSKLEQAVPRAWGRRVSYSKGWPKLPDPTKRQRKGKVAWAPPTESQLWVFDKARERGDVVEVRPGEFMFRSQKELKPGCECFDFVDEVP